MGNYLSIIFSLLYSLSWGNSFASTAEQVSQNPYDIIFTSRVATALDKVTLYPDSSYSRHSNVAYEEGALFEVLAQTRQQHEDNTQNQKFYWFRVRAVDGREGWIFGDGLAVILEEKALDTSLKRLHKKRLRLNNGFEEAVIWIAGLEGRDNLHQQEMMNPLYNEYYLVLTNERGQSVPINYAGMSAMGHSELDLAEILDVTGDNIPEIILQRSSYPLGAGMADRIVEVYSTQAGSLAKIFSERMTLQYEEDIPSPSLYKYIELADKVIRVEYIDYVLCQNYSLHYNTDATADRKERCLEFVTYTYIWDERSKMYRALYNPNRTTPYAGVKSDRVFLLDRPSVGASRIMPISRTDRLQVLKHYEKVVLQGPQKKMENYLFVRMPSGRKGYVPAGQIAFVETSHSSVLDRYYQLAPLVKSDWKNDFSFLKIIPARDTSVSNR